jgi:hypothetical protein
MIPRIGIYDRPPITKKVFDAVQIAVAPPYCFVIFGAVGDAPAELIVTPAP